MRPLRYSINVTLDGCCDHRAISPDEDLHRHATENLDQADALLFRDMQCDSAPDEALRKSCVWSKICVVRDKYKISVHSNLWIELCRRRGTILDRMGWFTPPFGHREPLLEALRGERPKRDTETKADLNAKLAVKELTRY